MFRCKYWRLTSLVSIHAGSDAGHELLISTRPFTMFYRLTNFENIKRLF